MIFLKMFKGLSLELVTAFKFSAPIISDITLKVKFGMGFSDIAVRFYELNGDFNVLGTELSARYTANNILVEKINLESQLAQESISKNFKERQSYEQSVSDKKYSREHLSLTDDEINDSNDGVTCYCQGIPSLLSAR